MVSRTISESNTVPVVSVTAANGTEVQSRSASLLERNNSTGSSIYATPMNITDDRSYPASGLAHATSNGPSSSGPTVNGVGVTPGAKVQPPAVTTSHPFLSQGATVHNTDASPVDTVGELSRQTKAITLEGGYPVAQNCWPDDNGARKPAVGASSNLATGHPAPGSRFVEPSAQAAPRLQASASTTPRANTPRGGVATQSSQPSRNTFNAEDFDVADRRLDRDPNAAPTPPPNPMMGGILGFGAGAGAAGIAHHAHADHQVPSSTTNVASPQPRLADNFNAGTTPAQLENSSHNTYDHNKSTGEFIGGGVPASESHHHHGHAHQELPEYRDHPDHHARNAAAGGAVAGGALGALGASAAGGEYQPNVARHDSLLNNAERPKLTQRLSRSYADTQPLPETHYDRPLDDTLSRRSTATGRPGAGSRTNSQRKSAKIADPPVFVENISRSQSRASNKVAPIRDPYADPVQRPATAHGHAGQAGIGAFSQQPQHLQQRPASAMAGSPRQERDRESRRSSYASTRQGGAPLSPSQSLGRVPGRLPPIADDVAYGAAGGAAGSLAVGEVASLDRQHDMQANGVQLADEGPIPPYPPGARPRSQFGYRPEPQYADGYGGRAESRLGRNNTMSRSATLGRNGTLQRAANGGTIGSRRGAFGRGAGMSVGTQPEEILGRDDIHTRAELSERALDPSTLKKLSYKEKKDARQLIKLLKEEGKQQARAVELQIKDMKHLAKLQREAIGAERKSQHELGKWTSREHKARMRFLKEKERYEKVEGELRNAENDYEERRDQAAGLTAQIAER